MCASERVIIDENVKIQSSNVCHINENDDCDEEIDKDNGRRYKFSSYWCIWVITSSMIKYRPDRTVKAPSISFNLILCISLLQ